MTRDLRRAAAVTIAFYVLQGLPLTLLLALTGISPTDRSEERNLLGPHAFWTSPAHLCGVLLFGATLSVAAVRVRGRSWGAGSAVIAVAVFAYVLPLLIAAAVEADAGQTVDYMMLLMLFTLSPLMSGWVAAGCAGVWFWLSRASTGPRSSVPPVDTKSPNLTTNR